MKRTLLILAFLIPSLAFALGGEWSNAILNLRGPRTALMNPAALASPEPSRLVVELPSGGGIASNNSFSVRYWNSRIAGGDGFWDRNETQDIVRHIPGGGLKAQAEVSVPALGIGYRDFAFNAQLIGGFRASLPRAVAQMALIGTQLDDYYSIRDLAGESIVAQDYSLAYGRVIPQSGISALSAGIAVHYYSGLAFTDTRNSGANFFTSDELIQGSGEFRAESGMVGHGYGVDLGLAAAINPKWSIGLAAQGIGAAMTWKVKETAISSFEVDAAGIDLDSLNESGYTDRMVEHSDTTIEGGGRTTMSLPTTITATALFAARPDLNLAALLGVATRSTAFGQAGVELGLAGEYRVRRWLVGQGGILAGGAHGSMFSLGTGLRFRRYEFDASIVTTGGLGTYAKGEGLWISQRVLL